jgi:hypothetical protein
MGKILAAVGITGVSGLQPENILKFYFFKEEQHVKKVVF